MHFILDFRATEVAEKLRSYGKITFFDAGNIVYPAISGHPDIFIANIHNQWILACNTPSDIFDVFNELKIPFVSSFRNIGFRYPDTALYNVFCDDEIAIVSKHTDESVLSLINSNDIITVKQGYIACNMTRIGNEFITSDAGIENALKEKNKTVHFVKPDKIRLSGVPNGFIGGAIGQNGKMVFFTGSRGSSYAKLLSEICQRQDKEIVFIGRGEALDVGGILVLDSDM
jgi:hypothetical protein